MSKRRKRATQEQPSIFIDYYTVLGVRQDALPHEIHEAWIAQMRVWNPYRNTSIMDPVVRAQRDTRAQLLNVAYQTLIDPQQRERHDQQLRFLALEQVISENTRRKNFLKMHIDLPDNDLPLLAALIRAYSSERNGEWKVATVDKRFPYMPDDLYIVQRQGLHTTVFRSIVDWTMPKPLGGFYSEAYLHNPQIHFRYWPREYGGYLDCLKEIAQGIAITHDIHSIRPQTVADINSHVLVNQYPRVTLLGENSGRARARELGELPAILGQAERYIRFEGKLTQSREGTLALPAGESVVVRRLKEALGW